MNRKKVFIAALAALAVHAGIAAAAPVYPLDGTKHDLSSAGTGSYKAKAPAQGGTTEICIFCHTPHSGNTEAPLWNRASSAASYQTYTSDVLAGLGYWAADDPKTGVPHSKTRICLSCHDGTIALGSVVNMPNVIASTYTEIQMSGNSKIQQSSPGYIGIDLRDDHPVAIKHDRTKDAELVTGTAVGGGVRLYRDNGAGVAVVANADGNYVECTSCHEPHNNQYGNFLVASNTGSALCLQCHTKASFANSIHNTAAALYSPPDGIGGSLSSNGQVSGVQCMNCHFPHKAGIVDTSQLPGANPNLVANPKAGYYLLSFQEEMSCFSNKNRWGQDVTICHGSTSPLNRNIQNVENSASSGKRHWTQDSNTSGKHVATEGQSAGWNGSSNWHVKCADCHNSHTAGNTSHAALPPVPLVGPFPPALTSTSSLYGTGGVQINSAPSWAGGQGAYVYLEPKGVVAPSSPGVSYEYQICLKCHSEFAWRGGTAPNSPSLGVPMTDQAKEFNPGNSSFHPVEAASVNNQGTLVGAWQANKGNQTMYCSDCHNNSAAPPQGPHGSSQKFILFGSYDDILGTAGGAQQNAGDMCMTCHDAATYVTASMTGPAGTGFLTAGGINLHASHAFRAVAGNPRPNGSGVTTPISYKCVDCHVRVPHGWGVAGRRAMVIVRNEGAIYGAQYEAGGAGAGLIWTLNQPGTPGTYGAGLNTNCTTATNCHHFP